MKNYNSTWFSNSFEFESLIKLILQELYRFVLSVLNVQFNGYPEDIQITELWGSNYFVGPHLTPSEG